MIYKYDFITGRYNGRYYENEFRELKRDAILQMLSKLPDDVLDKIVPIKDVVTIGYEQRMASGIFKYTLELDTEKKMFNIAEYYSDLAPREEVVYSKKDFV